MSTPVDKFIIPPINKDKELPKLLAQWDAFANHDDDDRKKDCNGSFKDLYPKKSLMKRDGDSLDPKHINGGHRIKSNPLLRAAIEEIRDGYFQLFNEKRYLLIEQEAAQKLDSRNKDWNQWIADIEADLINHSRASFFRLQNPDYGFSPEKKAEILAKEPDLFPNPVYELHKTDAAAIVGKIILCSALTFEQAMKYRGTVPHVPLKARPEQVSRFRSAKREVADDAIAVGMKNVDSWEQYVTAKAQTELPATDKTVR